MPLFKRRQLRYFVDCRVAGHVAVLFAFLFTFGASLFTPFGHLLAAETTQPVEATYYLQGLDAPAEIIVDHWGVPHIYAGTHYDAFFVQGFNAARDRLWQIDLWRRRGLGQLSEVLGASYLEQDKAARLFLYRGGMYREWLAYGSDAKRIAEAFTTGINAFVRLIRRRPELLPVEFELLDYEPSLWDPADVVRIRSNGLWRNVTSEVRRARIACQDGLPAAALWKVLEPKWSTRIPAGLSPCDIPENVLDVYLLAKAPVVFDADMTAAAARNQALIATGLTAALRGDLGSNNWVVAGDRTTTGRPILADDPHRGHAVPSLRYIAHLNAPGLDVIGAGEPALPGISIGHNQRIAFGLTIFPIDQEDLYVYEKRRDGYEYADRIEPLRIVQEIINVRDAPVEKVELRFSRHGPVVFETNRQIFAVRAAWLEPGMAPYFGSVEYMRAQNWREFVAALNRWGAPAENQVYADIDGNIGYKPAGLFPRRDNWDGLLPVPGDGRYEWNGYFDMDALPEEYNPDRGFTGTANAMNLPADYPIAERRVGFEWSAPWRYRRLWEVLEAQEPHSLTDSHDLQRDYHSILAREVISTLPRPIADAETSAAAAEDSAISEFEIDTPPDAPPAADILAAVAVAVPVDIPADAAVDVAAYVPVDVPLAAALEIPPATLPDEALIAPAEPAVDASLYSATHTPTTWLQSWDAVLNVDSPQAALYALWYYRHLAPALATHLAAEVSDLVQPLDSLSVLAALKDDPAARQIASTSLAAAWREAITLLGADPQAWRWGDLHLIRFAHPLLDLAAEPLKAKLRYKPHPRGGSGNTTNNTSFSPADFLVRSGASFRMVLDVGRWDEAEMTNAPGQSGDPESPFYRNLLEGWANDSSFPLLYSREAVIANQALRIELLPQ